MAFDLDENWLSGDDFEQIRRRVPIMYVNLVPIRVGESGQVTQIGLLLTASPEGLIRRSLVTGRIKYRETIRDAIIRHLDKDLGPVAFARIPPTLQPFGVFEYFPEESETALHDSRQHAIALAYTIVVSGECQPSQSALDFAWLDVSALTDSFLESEMSNGQHHIVKSALSYLGVLR
ncbi:MAG: DUF4916 domain-containing protein [Candidatus Nanopelagicales bacterium]